MRAYLAVRYGDDVLAAGGGALLRRRDSGGVCGSACRRTSAAGVRAPRVQPGGRARSAVRAGRAARRRGPGGDRVTLPLADVRVVSVEQFGAGPWGTLQLADLGAEIIKIEDPAVGGRRRPLRAAVPGGRGLALLRDVQPRQEERLARSPAPGGARASSRTSCGCATPCTRTFAATSRAKLGLTYDAAEGRQPGDRVLLAVGLRDDGPTRLGGRLRLHDAGARGLAEPDGRAGRASHEERAVARRPLGRLCVRDRDARGHLARATRRSRLRLRRVAVRDGPARADVHRPVGGDARVRAAAAARAPLTRRSCPSRTSRPRTAGSSSAAAKQASGSGCAT